MESRYPLISFVTCTYNSERVIKESLDSIRNLSYPQNKIQVIIIDGFSKDKTVQTVKKYPFVSLYQIKTNGPEIATALGYQKANGEYIVNFPSDNQILDRDWIQKMIAPLEKHKNVFASETLRYAYKRSDSMLNRYYALFGMNDPIAYYFQKCDRAPYFSDKWHLPVPAEDWGDYYIASFTKETLPTVGANGFVIRKKFAHQIARNPNNFFHMDTCMDLLKKGHNTYAFVKTDIWHKTATDALTFLKKRRNYAIVLYFRMLKKRRYHIVNMKKDKKRLLVFILLSLTIVEPLFQSVRGFIQKRDHAWFLHPIVCFLTVINYSLTVFEYAIYEKKLFK